MARPTVQRPPLERSGDVLAPVSPDPMDPAGTPNSSCLYFTAPGSAKSNVVPQEWEGCYVTLLATGANVWWFFTSDSLAAVDGTIAATDAGAADPSLGWPLLNGQAMDCIVPKAPDGGRIYFARYSDGAGGTVAMRRSSSP